MAARLGSALAFGGAIALLVTALGTRDLESYDHAFFSLDRGTAVQTVNVAGHPVYTLDVGLGVRLPLHGSLGASPVAALAPFLPPPLTYLLLLAFSIGAAILIVRPALEPFCDRRVSWLAVGLLFCSVPVVNYTLYDDWPETAVTYCAFVACVFAPHAWLAIRSDPSYGRARLSAGVAIAAVIWGLLAASHPGYWPLLATALVCTGVLTLVRFEYPWRARLTVLAVLAVVSLAAVGVQVPDITRDLEVAGTEGMRRFVEGPRGGLVASNLFPFGQIGVRMPYTFLLLALLSLTIGLTSDDSRIRRLVTGAALISVLLGIAAARMEPGRAAYAPSVTWALRDAALAFAVFGGAVAAATVLRRDRITRMVGFTPVAVALTIAALQGPVYAVRLVFRDMPAWAGHRPWTHDMSAPEGRAARRGLVPDRVPPGERLALWPQVGDAMRNGRRSTMDFVDGGYLLATAWTKQRTMRGLIEPNPLLFNQAIELPAQALCDPGVVAFLQLRYLLLPAGQKCEPWTRVPVMRVDEVLEVAVAATDDRRVRALPVGDLSDTVRRQPALSAGSLLPSMLMPLDGTSLRISGTRISIQLDDPAVASGTAIVLPVAYDSALRGSSGRLENVGGLAALVDVTGQSVTVEFVPDGVAALRAWAMTLAQVLAVFGFVGLAYVGRQSEGGPLAARRASVRSGAPPEGPHGAA